MVFSVNDTERDNHIFIGFFILFNIDSESPLYSMRNQLSISKCTRFRATLILPKITEPQQHFLSQSVIIHFYCIFIVNGKLLVNNKYT